MDKIRKNLTKAIEEKTSAYQRLSVRDIWMISEAVKNICESAERVTLKSDIPFNSASQLKSALYGCDDDLAIGFCD